MLPPGGRNWQLISPHLDPLSLDYLIRVFYHLHYSCFPYSSKPNVPHLLSVDGMRSVQLTVVDVLVGGEGHEPETTRSRRRY